MSAPSVTPAPTTSMPLFFKRVVGVNAQQHADLCVDRSVGFRFAATAQSVPLALSEIETAAQHYPVLFATGANPVPVALLGLRDGQNLFIQPDGSWLRDAYVPAYCRAFPFIFIEDSGRKSTFIGMEPDAEQLRTDRGHRLFEDGRPAAALNEAVAFCKAYRESVTAAASFARALDAAKVLEEEEATVNFSAGGSAKIRGFKIAKPERLAEVDDATFLEWRQMGWVAAIYGHLYSAGRWSRLIERSAHLANATVAAG